MNRSTASDAVMLRVPPHSLEAEHAVLGSLLLDNTVWDSVADLLTEADFYRFEHRGIYAAIGALVNATKPADVITTHEQLRRNSRDLESVDLTYLNDLACSVASAANARRYAEIVREKACERSLIAALDEASAIAWGNAEATDKWDRVASLFGKIEAGQHRRKEPVQLSVLTVQLIDRVNELHENGAESITGIETGIRSLDAATKGLQPGQLVVLAARTTVGKTSFAGQIALNVAAKGLPVLFLSQEMGNGEVAARAVSNLSGVELGHLQTGDLCDDEWGLLSAGIHAAHELNFLIDEQSGLTLMDVRGKARSAMRSHGQLGLIVVDYLQLMAAANGSDRRHHQIEQITRGLKVLAKELKAPVLLLSQLNRASEQRAEPELVDLKESGAIEEDADLVLLLHPWARAGGEITVLCKVAKNRGGKRGRVALTFDGSRQRWSESSADVSPRGGRA